MQEVPDDPDFLSPEEVANFTNKRTKILKDLPGGGVIGGTVVAVSDLTQSFKFELLISHKPAAVGGGGDGATCWHAALAFNSVFSYTRFRRFLSKVVDVNG